MQLTTPRSRRRTTTDPGLGFNPRTGCEPGSSGGPWLELYHDLRIQHTGWAQRIHATCFHHGTTAVGEAGVIRGDRQRLEAIIAEQLSPVGRLQVNTALAVMETLAEHLERLRRRLVATARHVKGARALAEAIYGVGPMTGWHCAPG